MSPEDLRTWGIALVSAFTGGLTAIGSAAVLRKRLSKDSTERTKDQVERDLSASLTNRYDEAVKALSEERGRAIVAARQAAEERRIDAETIARLSATREFQAKEIARMDKEIATWRRRFARPYPDNLPLAPDTNFSPIPPDAEIPG